MPSAESFVAMTRSPAALRAALAVPELSDSAVANPALPEDLWLRAYPAKPKPPAKTAKVLVDRPLTQRQLDHVIATETRPAVLTKAFQATTPTLAQLTALLDSKALTAKLANEITDTFGHIVDVAWLKAAADKVGGSARMEHFLCAPDQVTDADVIAALETYSTWCAEWDTMRQHRLLATRPSVLPGAVRSDSLKLRTSAAGCRHLTDPALQRQVADLDDLARAGTEPGPEQAWLDARAFVWVALVCNPACSLEVVEELEPWFQRLRDYESRYRATNRLTRQPFAVAGPFEDVTDHRAIEWILRRTLPGQSKNQGRTYDLPALLGNQHLTEGEVTEIATSISSYSFVLTEPEVADAVRDLVTRFPDVTARAELTAEHLEALVAEQVERAQSRLVTAAALEDDPRALPEDRVVAAGDLKVSGLTFQTWERELACAYLDEALADNEAAWYMVFRLLDEGGFAGTVADLALVVDAAA